MMAFSKKELEKLIANGETALAIEQLVFIAPSIHKKTTREEIIHLSARWKTFVRKERMKTFGEGEAAVNRNQIDAALIQLIGEIDKEKNASSNKRKSKVGLIIGLSLLVFAIAGIAYKMYPIIIPPIESSPSTDTIATSPPAIDTPTQTPVVVQETDIKKAPPPINKLIISAKINNEKQQNTFTEGEAFRLYYKVNKSCKVRIIYRLADDRLILIEDDRIITQKNTNKWLELGDGYEVAAPFGEENLYFFARTKAFPLLKTKFSADGYTEIIEGLPEALRKTRGIKKKVYTAETTINITTAAQ